MGRLPRLWLPGVAYHITSRGNQRASLFRDEQDFQVFLNLFEDVYAKMPYEMYAYCLMSNHYHLLLSTQISPLGKLMAWMNKRYADYFNHRYGLTGHVFEKRYFSSPVTEGYGMLKVSRYIHLNPLEACITDNPSFYPWSSYSLYAKDERSPPIQTLKVNKERILSHFSDDDKTKQISYQKFVESDDNDENFFQINNDVHQSVI